jgi:nucleotide-binding universal stress UspA family protein
MTRAATENPALPDRIVVGVDETGRADDAVRMGLKLGRLLKTPVDLVHAVPRLPELWPGLDPARSTAYSSALMERASRNVEERVRPLFEERAQDVDLAGGRVRMAVARRTRWDLVRIVEGSPAKVLLDELRRTRAPWLVLGSHEKRGFPDFGSTLRTAFAKAHAPVWVQRRPVKAIERILVPVDLSRESLTALATACALARAFDASVRAVHWFHVGTYEFDAVLDSAAFTSPFPLDELRNTERSSFETAMEAFPWMTVDHRFEFDEGEPAGKILEGARSADLVVLGAHGRTGLASVLLGGVAYTVLERCETPVLVIRDPDRGFQIP